MFCSFIPRQTDKSSSTKPALPKLLIRELAAGGVSGRRLCRNSANIFKAAAVVVVVVAEGERRRLMRET